MYYDLYCDDCGEFTCSTDDEKVKKVAARSRILCQACLAKQPIEEEDDEESAEAGS